MNHRRTLCLLLLMSGLATLGSCLSSAPPAPPVRWFDPTPAFGPQERATPVRTVQVVGQPHLVQEIAVRVAPFEVVYDQDHRWLLQPEEILRRAFVHHGRPLAADGQLVELTVFELQRVEGIARARVACRVHPHGEGPAVAEERAAVVAAADDSLEALTMAMGQAVAQLVGDLD